MQHAYPLWPGLPRHFYLVHKLPDVLKSQRVKFSVMEADACSAYIRDRLDLHIAAHSDQCHVGIDYDHQTKEDIVMLLESAHSFYQENQTRASNDQLVFGPSAVSQREFTRVFKLLPFFLQLLTKKGEQDARAGQRIRHSRLLQESMHLSIALVYYFRLPMVTDAAMGAAGGSLREAFCRHGIFGRDGGRGFKKTVDDHLAWFVSREHFVIPNAIALNQALLENVFAVVACTQTDVPLGIIGSPGSSKTLAYHIVRDNLLGPVNAPREFCKQFAKLDTFFYQCSRYSTAQDIESVFNNAIARQKKHDEQNNEGQRTQCVVFLDEAGLPKESRNVLKVLHSYLDERRVSFVCISNVMFDAANANRMVKVYRSKSTLEDLVILARGCAGIDANVPDDSATMKVVQGICRGYLLMLEQARFSKMFHYRDLIYLFRHLNRQSHNRQQLSINELDLLRALEENFNGMPQSDFRALVEVFFSAVAIHNLDSDINFPMPPESAFRDTITILRESIASPVPVGDDMSPRFKLLIDPTDGDASSMLFDSGILDSAAQVFRMSDFAADQSDVHAAETISEITLSMESAGCNVLVNTSRIDDSLYDLYNKRFRPSVKSNGDIGDVDMYANIAIGNRTHPKLVHADADFIVVLKQRDLDVTPAPFLSRFSKYLINAKEFFQQRLQLLPSLEKAVLQDAFKQVTEFVLHMRASSFYGLISTQAQQWQEGNEENAIATLFLSHMAAHDDGHALQSDPAEPSTAQTAMQRSNTFIEYSSLVSQAIPVMERFSEIDGNANVDDDVNVQRLKAVVQALCSRLLQICPPELLTLKLPTIGFSHVSTLRLISRRSNTSILVDLSSQ